MSCDSVIFLVRRTRILFLLFGLSLTSACSEPVDGYSRDTHGNAFISGISLSPGSSCILNALRRRSFFSSWEFSVGAVSDIGVQSNIDLLREALAFCGSDTDYKNNFAHSSCQLDPDAQLPQTVPVSVNGCDVPRTSYLCTLENQSYQVQLPSCGTQEKFYIRFNYEYDTYGFCDTVECREILELAAESWSTYIRNDFSIVPAYTNAQIHHPSSSGTAHFTYNVGHPVDDILIFVGSEPVSRSDDRLAFTTTVAANSENDFIRNDPPGRADWQPYVATITFATLESNSNNCHFGAAWNKGRNYSSNTICDLQTIAAHELGHALGVSLLNPGFNRNFKTTLRDIPLLGVPIPDDQYFCGKHAAVAQEAYERGDSFYSGHIDTSFYHPPIVLDENTLLESLLETGKIIIGQGFYPAKINDLSHINVESSWSAGQRNPVLMQIINQGGRYGPSLLDRMMLADIGYTLIAGAETEALQCTGDYCNVLLNAKPTPLKSSQTNVLLAAPCNNN